MENRYSDNNVKWITMLSLVNQPMASSRAVQSPSLPLIRFIAENCLIFFLQYSGLLFSVFTVKPLPFCLATGTSCAFIFMRGYYIVPGIFLGTVGAFFLTFHNLVGALIWGLAYSCQAVALFWVTQQFIYPTLIFYNKRMLVKFILLSCLITGITSFITLALFPWTFSLMLIVWLTHLNGLFIISTGLVTLDVYFPTFSETAKYDKRVINHFILLVIALLTIAFIHFNSMFFKFYMAHQIVFGSLFVILSLLSLSHGIKQRR